METSNRHIGSRDDALALLSSKHGDVLAHQVAEAIFQVNRAHAETLVKQLQDLLAQVRPHLDASVLRDLRNGDQATTPVTQAFGLGKLALAQLLTANVLSARADDQFEASLKGDRFRDYVKAMLESELSNTELISAVRESEETVCRKLRDLRAMGATDFRRDGRQVINFLTPLAHEVAQRILKPSNPTRTSDRAATEQAASTASVKILNDLSDVFGVGLEEHMKNKPTLSARQDAHA